MKCPALSQELRPCSPMYRTIDATTAQQTFIGSIDDRLSIMLGSNIAQLCPYPCHNAYLLTFPFRLSQTHKVLICTSNSSSSA